MPYSIGDHFMSVFFGSEEYPYTEIYSSETHKYTDDPILWIVFLPWKASIKRSRFWGLIPKKGTTIAYVLPEAFVNADPVESKRILLKCAEFVEDDIRAHAGKKIRVLSYSASNGIGFYIANRHRVDRFVSVVTGANLGESLWQSIATRHIKKISQSLGYHTPQEIDAPITEFLPINNTESLPADTTLYLGKHDLYYPLPLGLRVANKAKTVNPRTKIIIWPFGHFGVVLLFATLNRLRLNRTIYAERKREKNSSRSNL